jgi:hypothetical protein
MTMAHIVTILDALSDNAFHVRRHVAATRCCVPAVEVAGRGKRQTPALTPALPQALSSGRTLLGQLDDCQLAKFFSSEVLEIASHVISSQEVECNADII